MANHGALLNEREKKIFNLIAQKDSAHMKAIADEQRRIALAASRDSTSMQVISVITAVFLPATFTAVSKPNQTTYFT